MTRQEFLNTLKAAMHGLPQATIERAMADYERRFDDGAALGRSDTDIAQELGDPFLIAAALRSPAAPDGRHGVARAVRLFFSGLGLLVFNAFMVLPAMIYSFLLLMFYIVAVACYFGGIVLTASSLSGVNEFAFRVPFDRVVIESNGPHGGQMAPHPGQARVEIGDHGIHVADGGNDVVIGDGGAPAVTVGHEREALVVADRSELRSLKAYHGVGIILGGILLLLLCALVTRYTWIGMKRYVQMNIALLRTG